MWRVWVGRLFVRMGVRVLGGEGEDFGWEMCEGGVEAFRSGWGWEWKVQKLEDNRQ